jgi:signal transduction histidine kinase
VRVRTTIGATAVVGVALVVGSLILVGVLRRDLRSSVDRTAKLRARDVAALLSSGTPPTDLPVDGEESSLVQVLDGRGRVVASSGNVAGEPAIADVAPGAVRTVGQLAISDGHRYRVAAVGVTTPAGQFKVLAARSLDPADEGVASLGGLLAGGLPVLVLLVTVTTWVVTGRALRPVEAIRSEVSAITSTELARRVPAPPGDDEIARLARTMNQMLERLEGASVRQQRFVSDASHELRSPIATIRHELEVVLANPQAVEISELAERLLSEDLRMQSLVEDLLLLARADEGTLIPNRRHVDLDDLAMTEIARLRQRGKVRVDASGVSAG